MGSCKPIDDEEPYIVAILEVLHAGISQPDDQPFDAGPFFRFMLTGEAPRQPLAGNAKGIEDWNALGALEHATYEEYHADDEHHPGHCDNPEEEYAS